MSGRGSLPGLGADHVEAPGAPVGDAVLEADGPESVLAEQTHRLHGQDAIRPAAVGDDLLVAGQLGEALLELGERHRESARDVTGAVLFTRPYVEHRALPPPHAVEEGLAVDGLQDPSRLQEV